MIKPYVYETRPSRVVFAEGAVNDLAAEVQKLGCSRALVLCTPHQQQEAKGILASLGSNGVGVFAKARMHTPIDVTLDAVEVYDDLKADCVISVGGGSTIGLGKAIAWRNDAKQIVVPTTYAGSEVTPILGQTEGGKKTTLRDARILPEVVVYDPTLTLGLPVAMSVNSGLNAIAHAMEALYSKEGNPISSLMAVEGVRALISALPQIVANPHGLLARTEALYGSWLCGTVLGAVGMALHHKLCHTLGGTYDMPHAETHAILLPHTAAYNEASAARELQPLAKMVGGHLGSGLYDFAKSLGAPLALRDLGLRQKDLDEAANLATQNPYWNPRPVAFDQVRDLLQAAWEGSRPPVSDRG